jgi:hypothetical protein
MAAGGEMEGMSVTMAAALAPTTGEGRKNERTNRERTNRERTNRDRTGFEDAL